MLIKSAVAALVALTSLTGTALPSTAATSSRDVVLGQPLSSAHAHNDYEHAARSLTPWSTGSPASRWTCGWLTANCWSHDRENAQPGKTLASLYLDPLDDVVQQEGHSVYPGWDGSLQLLIDIKNDGESTYAAIEQELGKHPALLTRSSKGKGKVSAAR